ncbi:MAG: SDR family NAD(P)-dependent oxidoreductase, partial [Desulfosarcina sp.]
GGSLPSDATHTILADAFQGMPKARVNRYLASRGAFLNRVVQADLSFWDPDAQPLEADTKTAALQSDGATGGRSPQTILYRLVSEATGFASETLSRESRLLDDLNLDSIKAGDLIVRFTQTCGVSFPDPALLANATLGELADAAARLEAESANARAASTASRDDLGRQLTGMVSEITGFPEESLDLSMRLLDDLNLDSIKAGDLIARLANQAGLSGEVDAQSLVNASLIQVVDAISDGINDLSMETVKPPDVLAELLDQAARITGFSGEALDPDLPVERDLHLGPDKLEALVKKTTARLGIQAHLDIPPLLTRSLRQISVILQRMIGEQRGSGPDAVVDTTHQATWVRNFSMDLLPAPYPHLPDSWGRRSEDDWEKACVLILHGQDSVDLANVLKAQLFQRGATIQTALIGSDAAAAHVQDSAFSQLVAIMPRNDHREYDRTALLHRLIRRRASVVSPPPAASAPRRRTTVAWIQFGGGCFGREPRFARLDRCATVALGASLHLERKDLRVRVVDFCPTLPAETIARETLAELTTPDSFAAVGYDLDRTRRTLVPRLIQPSTFIKRGISWSTDDVILVTGGAKGITAACAVAVARKTGVRTALVGRTPHPDQAPKTTASREISSQLDTYAEQGLTADYFSCDVTDRDAVDRLLVAVAERFGPVTGIIHGAGLNRPRLTGQVKPQQAFDETAPKVLGLLHLLDAVRDRPPKLIVGMGSIIGNTGMPGNGWYGFSNEVMDIALRGFAGEHPGTQTLNAAYSIWRDAGMGARMGSVDLLREKGIDAIPTDDGVDRFLRLFTHDPGHYQMVVTARMGGLDTWNQKMPEAPQGLRFLENLAHLTPGVEAIFTAHLSLETDPYLSDHNFQGSTLFPTVFGLEAMAQAASWLAGQTAASPLQIKNVRLLRPITVDADSGADIVIRAVLSESANDSETVLRAGILKAGTGIRSDYFTATFIFGGVFDRAAREIIQRPDKPVPLIPETDLYRSSLLFQGPLFQRIQTIWDIRDTGGGTGMALFSSRLAGLDRLTAEAFGQENRTHLCLGDAFFTDTLLQSAALLVPQDTSLPVSIDRVDLLAGFFDTAMSVTVRVELLGQEDRDLIFQVVAVDEAGAVVAALEGYRLRILNHHDTYPTVADLLAPDERDRRLIGQVLDDACRQMSVTPPHLETACIPDIHGQTKAVRRKAERPMLERALSEAARRYDIASAPLSIRWHDSGKPTVAGVSSKDLDVSVTHEDRMCLCACGPGPVGCDLSAISNRSREQWIGLLGDSQADLLDHLIGQGDSLDTAGTRIWAGRETLIKIAGGTDATLRYVKKAGHAVLLVGSDANDSPIHILTVAVRLTWGPPLILASTVVERTVPRVPEHLLTADYPGYEPLYETRPFEMVEGGPQGQLVFVQRLPVTFQPSANLSRTIYFSNFIKWMGNTREASAWPVLAEMSDQFASGRWGGVTNYGHLKILGEGATSDQVEILMWVSNNSGPQNSTMTLSYDFRKMLKGGGYARLAFCRLQTTWVEIVGPGEARVAPYPAYYGQFIEDMCPRFDAPDEPEPMHESLRHLFDGDQDPVIYQAPPGPVVKPIVREQIFETTLAHANLVGNIYYANYYDWQGQIRDRFFYELIPDHYR